MMKLLLRYTGLLTVAGLLLLGGHTSLVRAQSGPGGVDDTTPTNGTDLRIWLRADRNVSTNASDEVTGWDNLVGETAETSVSGAPTLETNALGGKPVVRFNEGVSNVDNATDFLDYGTQDGNLSGKNTLIVVSKNSGELFNIFNQVPIGLGQDDFPDEKAPGDGKADPARGLTYSLDTQTAGDEVNLGSVNGSAKGGGGDPASGDVAIDLSYNVTPFSIYSSIANPNPNPDGDQDLLANGTVLEGSGKAASVSQSTARVGERLIGEVAEVIVLDKQVNAAERTIIHNYLATKYGISLGGAVSDKYRFDSSHPGEVAGVGQAGSNIGDAPSGNKAIAQSSGLFLDISPPGFTLTDGDYALYGHDNANLAFTAVETPNGRDNAQKLAREWRIDLTNKSDLSGATLGFDESALPSGERIGNTSYNDYFLFIDSDGDFSDGNAKGFDLSDPDADGVYTTNPSFQPAGAEISDGDYITIARVKRTINFTKVLGSGFENTAGTVSVEAQINFATNQAISVSASADPLTADPNLPAATGGGADFTDNNKSWQFSTNETDSRDVFDVEDDGTTENTELLKVTPGSLPSDVALGDTTRFEYSIIDDDDTDKIEFASGNPTSTTEGNTTVTFDVEVSNSGSGTAFFNITGDAVAGSDYEITSAATSDTTRGEVSLSGGTGSFDITILDDNLSEADENLTIELYAAKNGATLKNGGNLSETFTINDDEGVPSVSFSSSSYSGNEGTDVDVTLSLSTSAGQDLDVKVKDDGTGDASGSDYDFSSPKVVTIPSGNKTKSFSVTLLGDGAVEVTETIDLSIVGDGDTDPTVTTPDATTISILDNSAPGKVGPGGVGSADELSLWLRPDEGVTTDASGVNSWEDQSGNGNDATQTDDAEKPAFGSTTINGINVVTFDGDDDFLRTNIASLPSSSHALFSVGTAGGAGAVFGVNDGSFNTLRTLEYDPDASTAKAFQDGSAVGGAPAGGVSILASGFDGSNVDVRTNGGAASSTTTGTNANGTYASVGAEVLNSTGDPQQPIPEAQNPFGGELAEIIAYNQTLNKAQRLIVENYLAAKYSINSLSTDLYAGDLGADGTDGTADDRDRDVIGIGQASDGTKHVTAQGGGFTLSLAGGNDNGDFVFAGRKTGVTERINITDTSTVGNIGVTARINEDRYLDITGDLRVDITFNFSDSDIVGPAGDPSNYVLLRRNGTSGDWTKVTAGASLSSERVTFTNLSLTDSDDGYFTIGTTDSDDSPLDTRYITVRGDAGAGNDAAYYHFSAPTDGSSATFGDIVKPDGTTAIDFSTGNPNPYAADMVYTWDPKNQTWSAATSGQNITTGKGFILWLDDSNESGTNDYRIDPEYTFGLKQGAAFETDNVTVNVPECTAGSTCSNHGVFYMLGNPYLDAFDLSALNLDVDQDGNGNADFQQAVDVWDPRQSTYIVKTRGTSGDKVSRWQGFFVQRNDIGVGATELTFDNTGRVASLVPFVGSKSESSTVEKDWARVALQLTARDGKKTLATDKAAVLLFHESAKATWDAYDLSKRGSHGPTLALLGDGRDSTETVKSQESRAFSRRDTFTVDLQFETGHSHEDKDFVIRPHQWQNISGNWTLTLIDTKNTATPEDDEQVALTKSKTYQFERLATEKAEKAALSSEVVKKTTTDMPRFRVRVQGQPKPDSGEQTEEAPDEVEILRFEASAQRTKTTKGNGQGVKLVWETVSESGLEGFWLQHKTDAGSFEPLTELIKSKTTAKNASREDTTRYSETVEGLGYGTHTFRLKQVRENGRVTYSKTITTELALGESYVLGDPYPNPFASQAKLALSVKKSQHVRATLYDVLGRRVQRVFNKRIPAGKTETIRVRGKGLGSGVYFLRVEGKDFSQVRRLVHVR